jgi:oxalate decarboxylase/phosphoglucose isomerase-like protein (cupin superfamily)
MDKIVGISLARINFAPYGLNPPHIHPRETEILVVLEGTLLLGFVTSNIDNCLFTKVLNAGDVFVFPIGLIHFQFNTGCCANFNTRKRTNRLQYSVCASARSYPQGIVLRKLISIQTNPILT